MQFSNTPIEKKAIAPASEPRFSRPRKYFLGICILVFAFAFYYLLPTTYTSTRLHVYAFEPPSNSPGVGTGAFGYSGGRFSVGTSSAPYMEARFVIMASSTATDHFAFKIINPNAGPVFGIRNDGAVSIGHFIPFSGFKLDVMGNAKFEQVAVGTSVPSSTLHVIGDIRASQSLFGTLNSSYISSGVFGAGNFSFQSSLGISTTSNAGIPQSLSVYGNAFISGGIGVGTSTIITNSYLTVASSSNILTVFSDGRVGVGTVQPSSTLHIRGSIQQTDVTSKLAYATSTGKIEGVALGQGISLSNGTLTASGGSVSTSSPITANYVPFWGNATGGLSGTSTIYIDGGSSIGVGTIQPSSTLHVIGSIRASQNLFGNLGASNVTAGVFASGNSSFQSSLGIGTTTAVGLPSRLTVYNGDIDVGGDYKKNGVYILKTVPSFYSISIGEDAGVTAPSSLWANTAIGYRSLRYNLTGQYNTALGAYALTSNDSGSNNTALGYGGLYSNQTGSNNVSAGYTAGWSLSTGSGNVLIGHQAGFSLTTASSSIIIGQNVEAPTNNLGRQLNIGNIIYGTGVYAGATKSSVPVTDGMIGIGTPKPSSTLHVIGGTIVSGNTTTTNLTISGISGSTQCLQINSTGVVSGNGSACGGSGAVSTSSAITANYIPFWGNATGGLSGTSTIYISGLGVGIGTSTVVSNSYLTVASTSNIMTVLGNGRVGIGTSSPASALHVIGAITGTSLSGNLSATNVTAGVFASGNSAFQSSLGVGTTTATSLPSTLSVYGTTYTTATTTLAASGGSVGVGTLQPSSTLHVVGDIRATGSIFGSYANVIASTTLSGSYSSTTVRSVYISGKYAYVSGDGGLAVINISDPTSPTLEGSLATIGAAKAVVAGKYAYVVQGNYLHIVDISNPSSITLVKTFSISGATNRGVYVSGNYAYLASENENFGKLYIVDISNPSAPKLTATYNNGDGLYNNVFVSGKYAYLADGGWGMKIVDVSNPSSPSGVGGFSPGSGASDLYVAGKYAYLANGAAGLIIADISNPASPSQIGQYNTTGSSADVYVSGRYAYVADGTGGLRVIDVSNPSSPALVETYSTGGISNGASGVFVSGKYAYVAVYDGANVGLNIIDTKGGDIYALSAGSLSSDNLEVTQNVDIGNSLYVRNGLNVGQGGIMSGGGLSVSSTAYFGSDLIVATTTAPAVTTDKLYNVGGALYWNGSVLGGGAGALSTSSAITANYIPFWGNATGGLSGTSTIYASGSSIGIGTTQPSSTLHVIGTITGTTLSGTYSGTVAAGNVTAGVFASGNSSFQSSLGVGTTTATSLPQPLSVYGNAYVSGNVGIGEVAPGSKLSVSGGATIGASYDTTAAPTNGMIIEGNVGIGTTEPGNNKLNIIATSNKGVTTALYATNDSNTAIFTHGNTAYRSSIGFDSSNGNPFIGLHAEHSTTANTYQNDSTGYKGFVIRNDQAATPGINFLWNGVSTADADFSSTVSSLYLQSTGNVGIGTTNPTSTLQVAGTFNAYAGGGRVQLDSSGNVVIEL